jgi:hypothetical protein
LEGIVTAPFFFSLVLSAVFAFPSQQEPTQATPTVADAARAARERQKSSSAKRVVTDDDVLHSGGFDNSQISEDRVRAELEKGMPANPTLPMLQLAISQIGDVVKNPADQIAARYKSIPLGSNPNISFPGKKEWDAEMDDAVFRMVEEAGKTTVQLQALLTKSKEAFSGQDPEALRKLRTQWIEAEVPYVTWQKRAFQLSLEGEARAKAANAAKQPQK